MKCFSLIETARLQRIVSERDLAVIARTLMTKWEHLRPFLDLTRLQEEIIRRSNRDYEQQKREALKKWKELKGNQATYDELINAAADAQDMRLADELKKMIKENVLSSSKVINSFQQIL